MPLKFVLRPDEKVIINGAVIGAGDRPGTLFLYNTANFLRGREILKEEQVDCLEKKLYFVIQLIYIFPDDAAVNLPRFEAILTEIRAAKPEMLRALDEIADLVFAGHHYRALKICRRLFRGSGRSRAATATAGDGGEDGEEIA
ncbi:flagellar protein FlbT [uncultured Gammaproteobacteria bacterium]